MKPRFAKIEFEKFVGQSGAAVAMLEPSEGIRLMLDFYKQIRAEGCLIGEDGDMLLYEWGTYDWGEGPFFQCDITRQFIEVGSEGDDGMSQLSMRFYFQPSEEFESLKSGNHWRSSLAEVTDFESFIKANAAYRAVVTANPVKVSLEYSGI